MVARFAVAARRSLTTWRAFLLIILISATSPFALTQSALASCNAGGRLWTPANGTAFLVAHETTTEGFRGIHGGVSVAPNTPDPDPSSTTDWHIAASIAAKQTNAIKPGGLIWSLTGWQMGHLQRLPSGQNIWSHSSTVFFEGIDNVADFRDTYGAAEALGAYEVSWGGAISGRWKYNAWFRRSGTWFLAGYAELDREQVKVDGAGEATDTSPFDNCLRLTINSSTYHEFGSPDALLVLTDIWRTWTSTFPAQGLPDNGRPYNYVNFSAPNNEHFGVSGP